MITKTVSELGWSISV